MTIEVRHLGAIADDPAALAAVVAMQRADNAVRDPGDPPVTNRQVLADLFDPHPRKKRMVWLAEDEGVAVGVGWAVTEGSPDGDLQLVSLDLLVDPARRRQGIATEMVSQITPMLVAEGQNSICAFPCGEIEPEAGEALCAHFGLTKRSEERCSRALVESIDESLMDAWIAAGPESAPGYRLEQWEGVCPDEFAVAWGEAEAGMDDAPLDDFEYQRTELDTESQRAEDDARSAGGYLVYRSLALAPDGAAAGLSAIYVHQDRPEIGYQDDTAVLADHRGRRLGRWLKAANYRLVTEAHPELRVIETYNAQSNPWMLDINVAMGFRPHHYYGLWQAPLADVMGRLA